MNSSQIGQYGEKLVATSLGNSGYRVVQNTRLPGSTDIQADGKQTILVQVKTALHPDEPAYPSSDEIRNIKSRAAILNRTAWVAQVQIDAKGNKVGDIKWSNP